MPTARQMTTMSTSGSPESGGGGGVGGVGGVGGSVQRATGHSSLSDLMSYFGQCSKSQRHGLAQLKI